MPILKVPSVQHLARNWHSNPQIISKRLVDVVRHPPIRSYKPLFGVVEDFLLLRQPYEQVAEGIRRGIRNPDLRDDMLSILPLIRDHFDGVSPSYYQSVARRFYAAGRGLLVPFDPPLVYGISGHRYFPWFSFWRSNPLAGQGLSLFVTLVDDILLQDPDLEDAKFLILDFSVPTRQLNRRLEVIDAACIPRLKEGDLGRMLATFAEGYFLAKAELAGSTIPKSQRGEDKDSDTPDLFDDPK